MGRQNKWSEVDFQDCVEMYRENLDCDKERQQRHCLTYI